MLRRLAQWIRPSTDRSVAFERARYEYCLSVYEREGARRESLERKAQAYLTLAALFVGAVFLKADVLTALSDVLASQRDTATQRAVLLVTVVLFFVSLAVSLACLLFAMRVRGYAPEVPANTVTALFSPESEFLSKQDELTLHREAAMALALAVETDRKLNDVKARWIAASSWALFVTLLSMSLFISTLAYLAL